MYVCVCMCVRVCVGLSMRVCVGLCICMYVRYACVKVVQDVVRTVPVNVCAIWCVCECVVCRVERYSVCVCILVYVGCIDIFMCECVCMCVC